MTEKKVGAVLVAGGGIAGIQASLDLAESGYFVYLVEDSPSIGGVMTQLDKTFPTNDCAMCILSPKLVECARHLNIEVITWAEVKSIEGEAGNFKVEILKRPRYVDAEKCTGCGSCWQKCPVKVPSEFEHGLSERKAIYVPFAQAVPNVPVIDAANCMYLTKNKCGVCEKLCPTHAINFEQKPEIAELQVGAVILAFGLELFNARRKYEYGYGRFQNVITSVEFERILSASGPYQGKVVRPSDGLAPERLAFIQCVGSRDTSSNQYCSSVCCTYAIKEAIIAKEHEKSIQPFIFFNDMRTYGKDFDKYYQRAEKEHQIKFIRSGVARVKEIDDASNLSIEYVDEEGKYKSAQFDMVVLSTGIEPPECAKDLAECLGISLNRYGFCQTKEFLPVRTSREGIFVCGAFQGPKDIPETVMQASGAAGEVSAILNLSRHSLVKEKKYPPEIDVRGQAPRIGVFVCRCGINIAGVVDVPGVLDYVKNLPDVVYAEENLYACAQDTQEKIRKMIKEHRLNRIVVASCSPRTHEPLFQETIREAGLNRYLFEMANIRDQCSWVHMNIPDEATQKAKDLVRMAVAKIKLSLPLKRTSLEMIPRGLVIGGGIAGMVSALTLAESGFEVYLLEKEKQPGGISKDICFTLEGLDVRKYLKQLIEKVESEPLIHLYTETKIEEVSGYIGNFKTKIKNSKNKSQELEHGIIIVATGANEHKPAEYLYGQDERIITQIELEKKLAAHQSPLTPHHSIVMIQCVGSREEERMYCSRVCCGQAVKNALKLKSLNPFLNIYILYRDVRTYGFKENYYQQAREKGIIFIRYEEENKPVVSQTADGKPLIVSCFEPIIQCNLSITADLVVLGAATVALKENNELSQMLKIPLNEDDFFLEAHVKLRPVDFATDGIFVCGLAHGPKYIDESIAQAKAAASRAMTFLSKKEIMAEGIVAELRKERCSGCGLCVEVCAYKAIELDESEKIAKINEALCKGCGACAASCRANAIDLKGFKDEQIIAALENV